jgi:hypothetical protein
MDRSPRTEAVVNLDVLQEEIAIQLELLDATVHEIEAIQSDVGSRQPTIREMAATAAFLANVYTGVENVLKRVSRCYGVKMPSGEDWHAELFNRFCAPGFQGLPVIFDDEQKNALAVYRRFRHVIHHGYIMQLEWQRMAEGVEHVAAVYAAFKLRLHTLFGV